MRMIPLIIAKVPIADIGERVSPPAIIPRLIATTGVVETIGVARVMPAKCTLVKYRSRPKG